MWRCFQWRNEKQQNLTEDQMFFATYCRTRGIFLPNGFQNAKFLNPYGLYHKSQNMRSKCRRPQSLSLVGKRQWRRLFKCISLSLSNFGTRNRIEKPKVELKMQKWPEYWVESDAMSKIPKVTAKNAKLPNGTAKRLWAVTSWSYFGGWQRCRRHNSIVTRLYVVCSQIIIIDFTRIAAKICG